MHAFEADKPYVFISYSSANKNAVWRDADILLGRGVNVWLDRELTPGSHWFNDEVKPMIENRLCCGVLFYVSLESLRSLPVYNELKCAKDVFSDFYDEDVIKFDNAVERRIVPILIEENINRILVQTSKNENIEKIKRLVIDEGNRMYAVYKQGKDEELEQLIRIITRWMPAVLPQQTPMTTQYVAPESKSEPEPEPISDSAISAPVPPETTSEPLQAIPADSPGLTEDTQHQFEIWYMKNNKSEAAVKRYVKQLRGSLVRGLKTENMISGNLFAYRDVQLFEQVSELIQNNEGFIMRNSSGHNNPKAALLAYSEFLRSLPALDSIQPKTTAPHTFNHTITKTDITYRLLRFKKSTGIHEFFTPNMPVTLLYKNIKHETKVHAIELGRISSVPFVRHIPVGTELTVTFDGVKTITLTEVASQGTKHTPDANVSASPKLVKKGSAPSKMSAPANSNKQKGIAYTLYGEDYTESQTHMMFRFFAQVLKRHTNKIADTFGTPNLFCLSKIDFSKPQNKNKKNGYISAFSTCKYFTFENGESVCVGTSLNLDTKLRAMATLLSVCGEDRGVFRSDAVVLPEVSARSSVNSGKRDDQSNDKLASKHDFKYKIYGIEYSGNQSNMMFDVFEQVLKRHTDKIKDLFDRPNLACLSKTDYSKPENRDEKRGFKAIFRTCKYFTFDSGDSLCVGTSMGRTEKLKAISALLDICGENHAVLEMPDVTLPVKETVRRATSDIDFLS